MNTIAWLLILAAILLMRAVTKGRVLNVGEDLSDAFLAIVQGDYQELTVVLARTGDSNSAAKSEIDLGEGTFAPHVKGSDDPTVNATNGIILATAQRLGKAAKGYRLGATGPDYYDCSGLVWRAVQAAGYKGPRFVTSTIRLSSAFTQTSSPVIGDTVLWPGHHMGVMTKPGYFYSARNPRSGISEAPIAGFRKESPIYLRFTAPTVKG
jgi:hypothetical protein